MKITVPQAIIIGFALIALAILFRADDFLLATEAKAEVGGMDYYDLRRDRDFRRAVESILEDCDIDIDVDVTGDAIGDDSYYHSVSADGSISC